jgi:hypothetical protein
VRGSKKAGEPVLENGFAIGGNQWEIAPAFKEQMA